MKEILLKIARLPKAHQQWIIKQLPEAQRQLFQQLKGPELLKKAKQFRGLGVPEPRQSLENKPQALPPCALELNKKPALFTAIILHEGHFSWSDNFLNQAANAPAIREKIQKALPAIKEKTRQALYHHWLEQQPMTTFDEVIKNG